MTEPYKEVAEYISEKLTGCNFVGISSEKEVFVEFLYDDIEMQNGACLRIKREFPYISRVTVVVKPSKEEAQQMVEDLNTYLDGEPKKNDLLDIGSF